MAVVFWAHQDGLDFEAVYMEEIEEQLGVTLTDAEVNGWFTLTLGEVIAFLLAHQNIF